MKKLLITFLLLAGFWKTSFGQTGFVFDSIANPPYICQAHTFDVEVFGEVATYSTQYGSQHYFISNDTIYVQFHFVGAFGAPIPYALYRKINIPAPVNFGHYKIVAQGIANGQVYQTLTSAISICSGTLATPEVKNEETAIGIFPNPTANEMQITFPAKTGNRKLVLTDAAGRTVQTKTVSSGNLEVRLSLKNLPAGVYLLRISSAEETITKKIIRH